MSDLEGILSQSRPELPADLSQVPRETLDDWREQLKRVGVAIQGELGRINSRIRGEGWLPRKEYAGLCDWQQRAKVVMASVSIDLIRLRQEIARRFRDRPAVPKTSGARNEWRDRFYDLVSALESDSSVGEITREAAAAFLDFIDKEDVEREAERERREQLRNQEPNGG